MRTPLPAGTFVRTDKFGPRGAVPGVPNTGSFHTGQDYAAPKGTPILAAHDGVVTRRWWDVFAATGAGAGGWMVEIAGSKDPYRTRYAHMLNQSPVSIGQSVKAGQQIGQVGMTGASRGFHLHFEVLLNGKFIDPLKVINDTGGSGGGAIPIEEEEEEEMSKYFMMYKDEPGKPRQFAVFSPDSGFFTEFNGQATANEWKKQIGPGSAFGVSLPYWDRLEADMAERRAALLRPVNITGGSVASTVALDDSTITKLTAPRKGEITL